MFPTDTRQDALCAIESGWSLTIRDSESGSYADRDDPSGWLHATVKLDGGAYALLTDDGWQSLHSLAHCRLSYSRRRRVRLALALVSWLVDGSTPDDPSRWTLTGEGSCEVCGRTLTRSVARGFTTGPDCGGRVPAPLSERRGWSLPLEALVARAGLTPTPLPTPRCDGRCDVNSYCPDCDA
jgi:hypothetical protein